MEASMKIDTIKQTPFNTSLMGVIRGVFDYYDIKISNGMAYGGTGHAFMINIHDVVCPSGPYCWKYDGFIRLLQNLGLKMTDLGFFHKDHKIEERNRLEEILRTHLDNKLACSMQNMDNQIIYGYDEKGLLLIQPWGPECDVTPPTLTFGTWDEYKGEIHASYFFYRKVPPADEATIIRDSLHYALDLFRNPSRYTFDKYKIGGEAYDNWINSHEQGTAHEHGNWWNATVWGECRTMASEYFTEIAGKYPGETFTIAQGLSRQYKEIAELLKQISDKEKPGSEKIPLLKQAKEKELEAIHQIGQFLKEFEKK